MQISRMTPCFAVREQERGADAFGEIGRDAQGFPDNSQVRQMLRPRHGRAPGFRAVLRENLIQGDSLRVVVLNAKIFLIKIANRRTGKKVRVNAVRTAFGIVQVRGRLALLPRANMATVGETYKGQFPPVRLVDIQRMKRHKTGNLRKQTLKPCFLFTFEKRGRELFQNVRPHYDGRVKVIRQKRPKLSVRVLGDVAGNPQLAQAAQQ